MLFWWDWRIGFVGLCWLSSVVVLSFALSVGCVYALWWGGWTVWCRGFVVV